MLISHEVPLALMEESRKFNDYDYCLLHLTYKYPEYKKFYQDSIASGRKVLLDNSLFELGDALSSDQLIQGINEIKPTWYVVPDCWENSKITQQRFLDFKPYIKDLPGKDIGVAQGYTWEDLVECYCFMKEHASKIALPFGIHAYIDVYDRIMGQKGDIYPGVHINDKLYNGRKLFIQGLMDKGIWAYDKPHHLLGCIYASEFGYHAYKHPSIESCDTSNPIVAGLIGLEYDRYSGLNIKPLIKMNDLMELPISKAQRDCIEYNLKVFRQITQSSRYN